MLGCKSKRVGINFGHGMRQSDFFLLKPYSWESGLNLREDLFIYLLLL